MAVSERVEVEEVNTQFYNVHPNSWDNQNLVNLRNENPQTYRFSFLDKIDSNTNNLSEWNSKFRKFWSKIKSFCRYIPLRKGATKHSFCIEMKINLPLRYKRTSAANGFIEFEINRESNKFISPIILSMQWLHSHFSFLIGTLCPSFRDHSFSFSIPRLVHLLHNVH